MSKLPKIIRPIHSAFSAWLKQKIVLISSEMIKYCSIPATAEDIFAALVPEHQREILLEAGKLLAPEKHQCDKVRIVNQMQSILTSNTTFNARVIFNHPYPRYFLLPHKPNTLQEGSPLAMFLLPPMVMAQEWAQLHFVVSEIMSRLDNRNILARTFPWLPDLIRDAGWLPAPKDDPKKTRWDDREHKIIKRREEFYKNEVGIRGKAEQLNCDPSFHAATERRDRLFSLDYLTYEVATTIGMKLFTQYRLLKEELQYNNKNILAIIIPEIDDRSSLIPLELVTSVNDTIRLSKHDRSIT